MKIQRYNGIEPDNEGVYILLDDHLKSLEPIREVWDSGAQATFNALREKSIRACLVDREALLYNALAAIKAVMEGEC